MSLQPKDLRYTITTEYTTAVLAVAPKGWEEGLIKWIRNEKYWGMLRSFSIPMQFALNGRDVLLKAYYNQGAEAIATIKIERLDRTTWTYVDYFEGVADFYQCKVTDEFIEVNIIDGGVSQKIKANENTAYDINVAPYNDYFAANSFTIYELDPYEAGYDQPYSKGIKLRTVIEALLYHINGTPVTLVSTLLDALDADDSFLMIMTGKMVRRPVNADPYPFSVSLWDIFTFLNERFCIGLGVEVINDEECVVIENRSYFLSDTEITNVSKIIDFELSHAKQFVGNVLEYGYPSFNPDWLTTGWKVEPRVNMEISANIPLLHSQKLDSRSKIYADWFFWRDIATPDDMEYEGSYDTNLFIAHCRHSQDPANYMFFWYGETTITTPATTLEHHNLWLSPQRSLIEWIPFIESICYGIGNGPTDHVIQPVQPTGGGLQTFTSYDDTTELEGEGIDLQFSGYMFLPFIFKFKCRGTIDIADIFEANHNGYIEFIYNGVIIKGHIMEVSANPSRRRELEFTLLAHKDTNLEQLLPNYIPEP